MSRTRTFRAWIEISWHHLALIGLMLAGCAIGRGGGIEPDADPGQDEAADAATSIDSSSVGGADADLASCAKAPCDLLAQCGCTGGEVCDLDGTNLPAGDTECRAVTTPGTDGSNCTGPEGCAGGYVCLGATGQCRRFCDDNVDCGTGGFCLLDVVYDAGGGNFQPVPGATTCTKICQPNLATANGCPSSPQFGCRIFVDDPDGIDDNGDEYPLSDCTAAGAGGQNTSCATGGNAACRAGFQCVSVGGILQCKQTCVVGAGGGCTVGTCTAYTGLQPVIAGVTYGFCN